MATRVFNKTVNVHPCLANKGLSPSDWKWTPHKDNTAPTQTSDFEWTQGQDYGGTLTILNNKLTQAELDAIDFTQDPFALAQAQADKVTEAKAHDTSPAINAFSLNSVSLWLSKEERAALLNKFRADQFTGHTESSLFLNGTLIQVPILKAIELLYTLEQYASACYMQTQIHIKAIQAATKLKTVEDYDFKTGYPSKLSFTI